MWDCSEGDEIAIFSGEEQVGGFRLSETLNQDNRFSNFLTTWSVLDDSPGYIPGHGYTLRCWKQDKEAEVFDFEIAFSNSFDDEYSGDFFPEGETPYSIIRLSFTGDIPVDVDENSDRSGKAGAGGGGCFIDSILW